MALEDRIDIEVFKVVTHAIIGSDDLENLAEQISQLLTGVLAIKGCTVFMLDPISKELEIMGSFGLSLNYLNKGPVRVNKSIDHRKTDNPVVVADIGDSPWLQYPDEALREGIKAMVSVPIRLYDKLIGVLRLYHFKTWEISERDVDSLAVLAENIALAMMYTRVRNAFQTVKTVVDDVHPLWLKTGG